MLLTDAKIRNTKPATATIKLLDGHGLYLFVEPSGTKLWRYRYRIGGKESLYAAGEYAVASRNESPERAKARRQTGKLTLAEAREQRITWRALVKQGIHPAHQRKADRMAQQT